MKSNRFLRIVTALVVIFCLFAAPTAALAAAGSKGDKNFNQGLKYEAAEQWDKAAEEFALAVAANPKNAEFRLHYRRALFNASQMLTMRGRTLAEQKDFVGAYNAFRQAYGYDPTNELARAEMERMIRLQTGTADPNDPNKPKDNPVNAAPSTPNTTAPQTNGQTSGVNLVPTAYRANNVAPQLPPAQDNPQLEPLRDIRYNKVDLKTVIKDLAQSLDLNVIFDSQTFNRQRDLTIELKNVTVAQALDYIFLQENLFFQKIGKRAILVADGNQRQRFQQLVLRTFYLSNADPEKVARSLQQAIPPQPGRAPLQPIVDKDTNSITVRDTSENIKILSNFIKALDKDRAEVVMDVNIYEVSKNDLLQLGAQIGDANSLVNLGGTNSGAVGVGENGSVFGGRGTAGGAASIYNRAIGTGILLPSVQIQALQSKSNAKILASTQVHAFNNEESQARIGQRVPVRTAQLLGFNNNGGIATGNNGANFNNNNNAAAVYNYEQVGLTLKFTPIVFPNQDVQVKMSIESKDVAAGGVDNNPTFTERTITGTARVQNNRTLLLASVAQDRLANARTGLPILGLIPVLGRFFTAPQRNNQQVDIVIAVTPRVLRAPTILPGDEDEQPTGSVAVPTNSSLAELVRQEDREDQIAAARRLPNTAIVQIADAKPEDVAAAIAPAYTSANAAPTATQTATTNNQQTVAAPTNDAPAIVPKLIDTTVKTLNIAPTGERFDAPQSSDAPSQSATPQNQQTQTLPPQTLQTSPQAAVQTPANLIKIAPLGALVKGERRRVAVMVNSPQALRLAVLSLGFDASKIVVSKVVYGDVFGSETAKTDAPPFASANGVLLATLPIKANNLAQGAGVLAYIDIEAIADGDANLQVNQIATSLIGTNGENLK